MSLRSKGRVARPARPPSTVSCMPWRARGTRAPTFVFFVILVAKMMAVADVVVDGTSEIVLPPDAPYATRLAAEELNYFLNGVLGVPLPVVPERTGGRSAIVLGGGHAGRVPLPGGACGGRGATALPS